MPVNYTFKQEPSGDDYETLLDYARRNCSNFSLVVQPGMRLIPQGKLVLERLSPFLIKRADVNSWPGTVSSSTVALYVFVCNKQSVSILKEKAIATSLFEWQQPKLPEDLSFYKEDGSVWLTTTAHEEDAYLSLSRIELDKLKGSAPELYALLKI